MKARFFKIYLPERDTNICVFTFNEDPENTVYYFLDDGEDSIYIEREIDEAIESGKGKWEELSASGMKEMYHGIYADKINGVEILAKATTEFGVNWDWVNQYIQHPVVKLEEIDNYKISNKEGRVELYINGVLVDDYEKQY